MQDLIKRDLIKKVFIEVTPSKDNILEGLAALLQRRPTTRSPIATT